ncbi:MAG: LysR family transcriptional regulator [Sphingomonadales bacterium]|nr:LysR family transcriptional regulator [Sphingomonadales bacterium]
MDLKDMRVLVAAIEQGSIQAAARLLNTAQPALSRRLHELEAELGCALLVRGGRGVVPTPAGLSLYRDALQVLDAASDAGQRARRVGLEQGREVRLGLVQNARRYPFLADGLAAFTERAPNAGVALTRGFSRDLAGALRDGQLDATLLYERHTVGGRLRDRLVHRERYVLAAHPAHPLARPGALPVAELAGVPLVFVLRPDNANQHNPLVADCRLHGFDPVIARWAASPEEMLDFVYAGGGACITPGSTIRMIPPGQLCFRALPDFRTELELRLAWTEPAAGSIAARFVACLEAAIDRHQQALGGGAILDGVTLYRAGDAGA